MGARIRISLNTHSEAAQEVYQLYLLATALLSISKLTPVVPLIGVSSA